MKSVIVKGLRIKFYSLKTDKCPLCLTPLKDVNFTWNLLHGNAKANCCGTDFQLKDCFIGNPTKEEELYIKMFDGEYIEGDIKDEWILPIRKAMIEVARKTGYKFLSDAVLKRAKEIKEESN